MPTVRTQGGKVITKDGKVSCECCIENCDAFGSGLANASHAALTSSQYAALYAGGTWTINASGNLTSSGTGGDFDVTSELTATGSASNSYFVASPTCGSIFGAGSPTGSVNATGSYVDNEEPPFVFIRDGGAGTFSAQIFGYRIYNSGGLYPLGILVSARSNFYAQYNAVFEGTTIVGPPIEVFFGTDRNLLFRTQAGGGSSIALSVGGAAINLPAILTSSSLNDDPGTGSISLAITFTSSAP